MLLFSRSYIRQKLEKPVSRKNSAKQCALCLQNTGLKSGRIYKYLKGKNRNNTKQDKQIGLLSYNLIYIHSIYGIIEVSAINYCTENFAKIAYQIHFPPKRLPDSFLTLHVLQKKKIPLQRVREK